jgi:hypothetical protein
MNSRTTAIGVFNHPLIRAIIENDIAKASEVNRLIVEEVMAESGTKFYNGWKTQISTAAQGNAEAESAAMAILDAEVQKRSQELKDGNFKPTKAVLDALAAKQTPAPQEQDPLKPLKDLLGTFETMSQYNSGTQAIKDILNDLPEGEAKTQAMELLKSKRKSLRPPDSPAKSPQEEPNQSTTATPNKVVAAVDSAVDAVEDGQDPKTAATQAAAEIKPTADSEEQGELADKIETVIGQKVAAAQPSADTEAEANEEQLEPLLAAYSNFENEFMDVPTLREQGNILVALMKALTEFEKTAERSAVRESANPGMEKIDAETKVDLRKSVEGIKRNMSSVLSALKQYKSKMFDINSNDIKKVVVSALNNIQDELKRAYDALECEVRSDCNKRAHKLKEQVTDESISQVRKAYNTILSAISEFYNEAQKGRYKVSFRDSTFAKAREAIEGIQDYFPQISPFSTGQSIDQITPQLSKVFMKLRPVMDEFLALSKETTTRRDTINKFMERTKEVSLEINNLFGAETEIPAVEKEIEAVPAATADTSGEDTNAEQPEAPAASAVVPSAEVVWDDENDLDDFEGTGEEEEEEEGETPDQEKEPEVEPEEEEEEEEAAPVPVPAAASEETPDEEPEDYNSNWIGNLNIEQEYIDQLTGDGLRNEINNLISDTLAEATPKLRTLGAKAKGMVPSKFSFLAKTLDKFEIGNQSAKTLLKALKDENPKYVIALNLIPKDKLEGYLKNWVGLKLKIQHREDLETLDDWKEYGEYLKNNAPKNPHGNRQISDKDMRRFFDFLQANANNLQYGDWDILEVKYDSDEEEINLDLMFNEETDTESLDAANIFPLFRDLKTKDDSLQEQITKLLTPMIREQIRGKNG